MTINITVQSPNLKDVDLIRLNDFSTVDTILNNETVTVPYTNYLLEFGSNFSNIDGNSILQTSEGALTDLSLWTILIIITTVSFGMLHIYTKNKRG